MCEVQQAANSQGRQQMTKETKEDRCKVGIV